MADQLTATTIRADVAEMLYRLPDETTDDSDTTGSTGFGTDTSTLLELQKENERLRNELGYGQTVAMQFPEELAHG